MRLRRPTRTAGLAAIAAVAVLALAGLARPGTAPDTAATGSIPPTEEAPPGPDRQAWTGVEWGSLPDPFPDGDPTPIRIDGLTAGNGLVVGWGRVDAAGRNQFNEMGAVFVSADGERWRSIALDDGVGGPDTSEPYGVTIGPLGLLAYGGVCCSVEERAIWASRDGLTWTRLAIEGDLDIRSSRMARVVGLPTGWVAVGSSGDRAAIWTSDDGGTWRAVDAVAADLGRGVVSDAALLPDGRLIAVGTIDDPAATHDGAVWLSNDGVEWRRVAAADPTLTGPDETELWQILPFASGLFLVGNHGSHEDRVSCEGLLGAVASIDDAPPTTTAISCGWGREHHWLSADASSWRRLAPRDPPPGQPAAPGIRPIEFRLLASAGPGLVLLGEDSQPPDGDSALWASADGATWVPIDVIGRPRPPSPTWGFVVVGTRVVTVGEAGGAAGVGPFRPVLWVGRVVQP